MTTVTVLSGERTIGGTQIVVEHEGARLLFDCGLPFEPANDPFAHVRRRSWRLLPDLLALGLTPYLPNLYPPSISCQLPPDLPMALPPVTGPLTVALSHSHLDHSHLVGFVDPSVPVYTSEPAARILRVLSDTGARLSPLTRPVTSLAPGEIFDVGAMRVRLLPVDHDVDGACGLIVETPDGVIAYSGDLRLHGPHPMRTLEFAQTAREAGADLLILEGTRLFPPAEPAVPASALYERAETDVAPDVIRALAPRPDRLGIILLTPENGERVEALANAAHESGRLFAIDPAGLACTIAALGRMPAAPHAVYLSSALVREIEQGFELPSSVREVISAEQRLVTAEELAADPGRYLLRLPFEQFADLLTIVPRGAGGTIVTANAAPLGSFDPAWTNLEWWARFLGMEVVQCGSSGHATPRDLALIAAHSGAPVVMAIHSLHPALMPVPPDRLLLPERGRRYDLAGLR